MLVKSRKSRKIIFIASAFLSVVLFINGIYALNIIGVRDRQRYGRLNRTGYDSKYEKSEVWDEAPVNLLVLGLDDEEVRSDVILLLNYSPTAGKINILSIARDTRVYVKGRAVKINALISMGGERMVVDRVQKLTGLPVHYYLTLDFTGFREIIDALDGVEFDIPFDMDYDDPDQNLHIHLRRGHQVLDGRKAEQLVRYRKGNRRAEGYEDGDIGRIKMQQEFLKAVIRQKAKLKYLTRADDVYFILREYLVTNMGIGDIRHYAGYLGNIKADDISTYTILGDTVYRDSTWYFIYDSKKTQQLINDKFYK